MLLRRGALLFFKVIRQISRSHGSKNRRFWPKLAVSGLYLQFEITDGYEMMHNAWNNIEKVPYSFSRSNVKLQGHVAKKKFRFFLGHPSNFKVTQAEKWQFQSNLSKITRPAAVIKSLRFALFKVICQISRSHGAKNHLIWPRLRVSGL